VPSERHGDSPKGARISRAEASPAGADERISAVDILRGIAVLGILVINIEDFALAQPDSYLPSQLSHSGLVVWTIVRTLFEGEMKAIFSTLFGASVVLLSSRLERRREENAADGACGGPFGCSGSACCSLHRNSGHDADWGGATQAWSVLSAARSRRFYILLSALGLALGLPMSALTSYENYLHRFDPAAIAGLKAASDPARLCLALGYIGLVMLLVQARGVQRLKRELGDAGRMALSNYLTATIVCTTLFNGYGFGLFGSPGRSQLYLVVLGVWCFQLLFSHFWLRAYRFGPAEWAWRSLTYWKIQILTRG
jgi:uncharacterized membrane protein YeiB